MATPKNIQIARQLINIGAYVFPVYVKDTENPYKKAKTPGTPNGFKDATNDPFYVEDLFEKHPNAEVGVYMGASGLFSLDVDVKRNAEGEILEDGFQTLEDNWLVPEDTFAFDSVSRAGGRQYIYLAPEGKNLAPSAKYRGLTAIDTRAGGSWSVWPSDVPVPESRDVFAPAPEWMLDEKRTVPENRFSGTIKEWYDSLEPGEPSAAVRREMERVRELFESQGNDLSHSDLVERQHSAVRLGAEGHAGVPELLDLIEELTLNREGSHTRDPDEYEAEFQEALASGIRKHGEAIELRKNLPDYSITKLPDSVPDSLVSGAAGGKDKIRDLIRNLAEAHTETPEALSIVWNAPVTRDLARDWGLEFVNNLIEDAKTRVQEPEAVVPVRDEPEKAKEKTSSVTLLTEKERAHVDTLHTFVDSYSEKVKESMGFVKTEYSHPLAWTVLSMTVGRGAVIPINQGLGVNLWFAVLGYSGTGKSTQFEFAQEVLDGLLGGHESYWGTGAGSPEGIIESLVKRDGLPSALFEDEGAAWYKDLTNKDWMRSLSNQMARWYMGKAIAPQKRSLKELAGKVANISFNYFTISTPDDTLRVIDEEMFATGFMARVAWVYGPPPTTDEERFTTKWTDLSETGKPVQISELTYEMSLLRMTFPEKNRVQVGAPDAVRNRLDKAWRDMQKKSSKHPKFDSVIEPSVQRLRETLWKCAALLAVYRGSDEIDMDGALVALSHVEVWYATLLRVSDEVSGAYLRDARLMADYIRKHGGQVTRAALVKSFGHLITRSRGELADRIDYLVESGQVIAKNESGKTVYEIAD